MMIIGFVGVGFLASAEERQSTFRLIG